MSYRKYAPITAALLARKGEAAPAPFATDTHGLRAALQPFAEPIEPEPVEPEPAHTRPARPTHAAEGAVEKPEGECVKPRRLYVQMSPAAYHRLAIAAVKADTTPHGLLRRALDAHLAELERDHGDCPCLAGAPCLCP